MKHFAVLTAILCTLFFNVTTVNAQTTLAAGDIAFTGINSDDNTVNGSPADDDFSFIILRPAGITAGTEIYFTDAGWRTDANAFQSLSNVGSCVTPTQSGAVTDGIIKWTASSAMAFGTQVRIRCKFNVSANVGTAVGVQGTYNSTVVAPANPDEYLSLSTGGDQITAYQGTYASPTLLAIINQQATWGTSLVLCDFCSTCTSLPPALSSFNQLLGSGLDNAAAKSNQISAALSAGTPSGAYAVLTNTANWNFDDATAFTLPPASSCALTASQTQTNVSCNGLSNGQASVTASAGTTPYTYSWAPSGGTGSSATGLAANTYTVTINDASSCSITRTFNITQPTVLAATPSQTNVSCNGGNNGSASVSVSGGTPGYAYSWAPSGGTSATTTSRAAGTYTVTITDANACQITRTFNITQPSGALTATTSQTNVSCNGGNNGSASVLTSGGTPSYTYSWAPSGGTAATASGRTAGSYTVTITDANSCQTTRTFSITEPNAIAALTSQTNISCNAGCNGSASVAAIGGTGSLTYSWAPSGGTGTTASGLCANNYTVTITDANTCQATKTFSITQPPAITGTITQTNVTCAGANNGSANVAASGGTGSLTYSWAPSGGTAATASGLGVGTYTVTITDANSCSTTRTVSITAAGSAVSGTTVVTNVACFGGNTGAINLTPTGGTTPYTYNWLPSGPTVEDRTGLVAGTYSVQITDGNSCSGTVTVTVTQPTSPVSGTTVVTNVACFGGNTGAINLTGTGGTGPYTYNWLPSGPTTEDRTGLVAGTYSVQITDANSCTGTVTATVTQPTTPVSGTTVVTNIACFGGNTGAINLTATGGVGPYTYNWLPSGPTVEDRTGLVAGTYSVQITDANSCTGTVTATVTQPAAAVSGTTVVTNVACFGGNTGAINLTATGGVGPYTFNWLPSGPTTEDRTGLTAGTYAVQITDANGCTGTVAPTVTQPAAAVSGTTVVTNVACFGGNTGAINLTATGGVGPYTYNWLPSGPTVEDRTGLVAGTYSVQITDANSCTGTVTATVTQPTSPVSGTTVVTNIACFGGNTGAINLTATGGVGPYTYNWLPSGPTVEDRTGLVAGTYSVQITDANSCTGTVTATVTQPVTPVSGTTVVTNVACFGGNTGAINLTATGGVGPYTYNWLPSGPTVEDRTGLVAGTYSVQITDANSCTGTVTATVTQPSFPVSGTTVVTNIACFGGNTGAVNLTATGGTGPYTYNWLPSGPTTEDRTGLVAGSYSVQITDANSCMGTVTLNVTQPAAAVSGTTVVTNVACFGGNTGAINLTATGGVGPYTYNWLPSGPTTEDRVLLTAGTYTVQITDANGCTGTVSATLTQPAAAVSGTTVVTNVSCNGGGNGAINLTATGGQPGYTYNWLPSGPTVEDRTGLAAGTYTVQITDANGCTGTVSATVTEPNALGGIISSTNATCSAADGTATVTASGGTPSYTYSWAPSGGTSATASGLAAGTYTVTITDANSCTATRTVLIGTTINLIITPSQTNVACNGGTTGSASVSVTGGVTPYIYSWAPSGGTGATASGLAAGNYTVTITDDVACQTTQTFNITQPTAISSFSVTVTNVSCFEGANGAINFNSSGGTGTHTYLWSDGSTNEDLTGVTAGTYTVTVTDANSCTEDFSYTITEPTAISPSAAVTNSLCSGLSNGSIDLTVTGGTGAYTYAWSNSETTEDITGLADGTYYVTITDANSCVAYDTVTLQSPVAVTAVATVASNVNCNGGNNGKAFVTASGGTTPYIYAWSTGATSDTIANRVAGTYSYTVTDANSCNVLGTVNISQPAALAINTTVTANVLCFGNTTGSIDATVTGGVQPYTYNWSNNTHNEDLANVGAGSYSLTVIDANGCQVSKSAGTITQPANALMLSLDSSFSVKCNGAATGSIYTTVVGGTTPYTMQWSNGATSDDAVGLVAGTYTLIVTDNNSCSVSVSATISQPTALTYDTAITNIVCNGASTGLVDVTTTGGTFPYQYAWSNASTNEDLVNITAGSYTLTITDDLGCSLTTGPLVVTQPAAFGGSLDSTWTVKCFGESNGALFITVTGATPPYTYAWSNGTTTDDITNVPAGAYVVTITDAASCTFVTPPFQVTQPAAALSVSIDQANNATCNGVANASIDITAAGGTAPYTYLWSNGDITADITGLGIGTYTVTVTDSKGCATVSQTVTITEPAALSGSITTQDIGCNGDNTGSADLTVSGGTTPYTYLWSNTATTQDISSLVANTYTVTITDANSCSLSVSATVTQPALLTATAVATDALCNAANGSVDLTVAGGTQPYGYNWSNSTANEDLAAVAAGTYTVTVNDDNGCIATATATVNQPTAIAIAGTVTNAACNANADGEIDITVTGGTGAYTYAWSNSETTEDVTGLTANTYTVTVTDANSCTASASFTVTEPAVLALSTTVTDATCFDDADGEVDLTVTGGTSPYTYAWDNSETTEDITGLTAGAYVVTVTDDNGCSTTVSATVNQPAVLALSNVVTNVSCNGLSDGEVNLTVTGGTSPYTYAWSNSATTEDVTGLTAGNYDVSVTDDNGCSTSVTVTVTQPAVLSASASATDAVCNGANGTIDVTVTGGTSPYTYAWSNSATTEDLTATANTYGVTITDDNGCSTSTAATINEPSALNVQAQATNATCPGAANGEVNLTVSGGTFPYTYLWSNGTTNQDVTGLAAGTYDYTVTDDNGCSVTATVTITAPAAIAATENIQNVTCNGTGDGAINVTVTGGTAPYVYAWSNSTTSPGLAGVGGGTYSLTITDYYLCTAVFGPYVVNEPLPIVVTVDSFNMVKCFGTSTGNIYGTVVGGTQPYTYAWSNGATTEDLIGVPAGVYTGTVTDANGCTFVTPQLPITQPTAGLSITLVSTVNVTCNGLLNGELTVDGNGGTAPYTYIWNNTMTGDHITGLAAGTYTVTITDANGCSSSVSATVTEPAVLTLAATGTDVICEGGNNGAVNVTTTGGTAPYNVVWSTGTTTNLVAGTYTVTVTDDNGCSASASVQLTFTNTSPTVNVGADVTQCGGTVTLDAGNAGSSFAWSNGGTAQTTVVGATGTYSVVVTTQGGCTGTDTVNVTINNVPQVVFNVSADTVCLNAPAITLTGTPAGGTFAGTLVSGSVFTPSAAGQQVITYTYTDGNNCTASVNDTVQVDVCVGIEGVDLAAQLNVYPIPNNGSFTIAGSVFATCELTNNVGQLLQQFELNADNNYTYNVQNLSAGVYYVLATNGSAKATYKVLVID